MAFECIVAHACGGLGAFIIYVEVACTKDTFTVFPGKHLYQLLHHFTVFLPVFLSTAMFTYLVFPHFQTFYPLRCFNQAEIY